eukprot:scaffold18065_cov59-Phaeocystis_antarctica.AAC.5
MRWMLTESKNTSEDGGINIASGQRDNSSAVCVKIWRGTSTSTQHAHTLGCGAPSARRARLLPLTTPPRPGPHCILPSQARTPHGGCGGGGGGSGLTVQLALAQNGEQKLALRYFRRQRLAAQDLHLGFALKLAITCCQTAVWRPWPGRQLPGRVA